MSPGSLYDMPISTFPQALFFDFDGVLVDSVPIKTQAFRDLLREYGDEVIGKVVAYHKLHGGISRVEKIRYAFEDVMNTPLTPHRHEQLAAAYSNLVLQQVIDAAWINGAERFLNNHYTSVPIFVISGTPENELRQVLKKRGMAHYFEKILGSPMKKPGHIRQLAQEYGLDPARCVFIGDAFTDLDAARETGTHFIGIQGEVEFPETVTVLPDCRDLADAISALARR